MNKTYIKNTTTLKHSNINRRHAVHVPFYALLALCLSLLAPLSIADSNAAPIHVTVKGMVCDFCARGIEKVFKKRDDIVSIAVDLSAQSVTINTTPNSTLTDATITELIEANGINVAAISRGDSVTAAGASATTTTEQPASTSDNHAEHDHDHNHEHNHDHSDHDAHGHH